MRCYRVSICAMSYLLLSLAFANSAWGQSDAPAPFSVVGPPTSFYNLNAVAAWSNQNPVVPQLILTAPLDKSAQRELTEDLQVMDNLLMRALGGDSLPTNPYTRVLGVLVNSRHDSRSRVQFIQGVGVVFRYEVGVAVAPSAATSVADDQEESEESDWEVARRQLFTPSPSFVGRLTASPANAVPVPPYNADLIKALRERVNQALRNVGRIRHLGGQQDADPFGGAAGDGRVIVVTECGRDGSVMTFSTTQSAIEQADDSKPGAAVVVYQYRQSARSTLRTPNLYGPSVPQIAPPATRYAPGSAYTPVKPAEVDAPFEAPGGGDAPESPTR
jgi:hypothetical protein